tara:strand:+ start:110279 stop:111313 length:1035 start_codon:yes stop_codon:yes gene_type:complete
MKVKMNTRGLVMTKNMGLTFLLLCLFSIGSNIHAGGHAHHGETLKVDLNDKKVIKDLSELNLNFEDFMSDFRDIISEARDGDVVGNGGGQIEGQVQFYLNSLPSFIMSALNQDIIYFTQVEKEVLERIAKNITENAADIVYIDNNPNDFFSSDEDGAIRIAKTGFHPKYPIFLNRTMIYSMFENDVNFNILSVLVHELGHQAGIKSHRGLDDLGAKMELVSRFSRDKVFYEIGNNGVSVEIFNHGTLSSRTSILVTYFNQSLTVKAWDFKKLQSKCGTGFPAGFQLLNPHWTSRPVSNRKVKTIKLAGWMNIVCVQRSGSYISSADFEITLTLSNVVDYKTKID